MTGRLGTVMYIPHENSKVKSLRLSRRATVGFVTTATGVVALLIGMGAFVFGRAGDVAPRRLVEENDRLRDELTSMEADVVLLGETLDTLLHREEELRLVADLPAVPMEIRAVGVGGPGHPELEPPAVSRDKVLNDRVFSVGSSLDRLLRRSDLVATSMEDASKAIAVKNEEFEKTPSIWPASGFLTSTFSLRRPHPIFDDMRPHYGIDISANRGSAIMATAAGTIVKAGWESGHGNYVEIDHGHGLITTYSHASRLLVRRGQKVERGDTIALVGSTGFASAPHVHYEVHEGSRPVNPLKYIFPDAIAD